MSVSVNTSGVVPAPEGCDPGLFRWQDYAVLVFMLAASAAIGLFYGCVGPKQKTASDFLLGGSSMATFPMAMSLAASFVTAIELLGNPAEMYNHGSQFWMICLAFLLVMPVTAYFYLPVYMSIDMTSAYEYLELRFHSSVRTFASGLYVLQMVLYTSVAVYAPALALSHVTGLNTYLAVSCIYGVCILYASQGGMKAVMMTDTFQAAVLIGSILLVLGLGDSMVGGPSIVWKANDNSERIELFKMSPDPTERHTFWSVVIGGTFYWLTMFCANQASIQKYLSVETIRQARMAIWVSCIGLILIFTINFYTGMIIYATYRDCDPLSNKEISASDQLLPLFVMKNFSKWPGVAGFFVAGIFSASLGTVAAALNSLAAVTVKDFILGTLHLSLPDDKGASAGKWISLGFGMLSFALVFVVEQLGSVLQVALSFNGMVGGVTLGMFSLGMFFPWANSKGVMVGAVAAFALVLWIGIGSQVSIASGAFNYDFKPLSTSECKCISNSTAAVSPVSLDLTSEQSEVFLLYRISYLWYSMIGCVVTVIVGMLTSMITGLQSLSELDSVLISPPIIGLLSALPTKWKEVLLVPEEIKQLDTVKRRNQASSTTSPIYDKGVVNLALNLDDEKINYRTFEDPLKKDNNLSPEKQETYRKLSLLGDYIS